ncbi:phosphodiester glycosidase family protein [Flavobacterium sp.]|uniref:phosphodiester glycosidase family protein n=1 Tax=Flavobacterium sp. TaxID=239 RepID=UPI001215FFC8|nr:phosphodiester glycosidase family protein [Flavobacterium sp.]RZJ72127.1 MAG: hypothetical protein EOO49_06655 [Flavobacterium sp.]
MNKFLIAAIAAFVLCSSEKPQTKISSFTANLSKTKIQLFWKDAKGNRFNSISKVKKQLESRGKTPLCIMNGGMFQKDFSPQGLYIENGKTLAKLDVSNASGNFYLKPNGVFYITSDAKAHVRETSKFVASDKVNYATQSGPMLVVDGKIHPAFSEGSKNVNIRNGVGILANGNVLFAISEEPINFYDFARFFKDAGCANALYLDGFVSRAYIPSGDRVDGDGNFGVMIAVISDPIK